MAGTYFNKQRKLGTLEKDLGSSDVISLFTLVLKCAFCQLVEGLFRLNMAESD